MPSILDILAVFLGSGLGGVARYLLTSVIWRHSTDSMFPWGTFVVNILGCLAIGIISGVFAGLTGSHERLRILLSIGFCGGFTTFSSFIGEGFSLVQAGNSAMAVIYAAASLLAGFLCLWAGYALVTRL